MTAMEMLADVIASVRPNPGPLYTGADVIAGSDASATEEVVTGGTVRLLILASPKRC
jgi:hypothetical protein